MGRDWFAALDEAVLAAQGVDLQLCMMQPAQALAATRYIERAVQDRILAGHRDRDVEDLWRTWGDI